MEFEFLKNPSVVRLFDLFEKENKRLYIVGGAVRNAMLGKEINDIDFATATKPDDVLQILLKNNIEVDVKGMKFVTITAMMDCQRFDITTFRKDTYARGSRFPEIICSKKLRDDFIRRDFTVNAIYIDRTGRIIDLGNGVEDLKNGVVKFIIKPKKSVFLDPLRILRYFRFCSLYFYNNFDEPSLRACLTKLNKIRRLLPRKKIKSELAKILQGEGCDIILDIWRKNDAISNIEECITEVKFEMENDNG